MRVANETDCMHSQFVPFEPSEWAAGLVKGADYVAFTVTKLLDGREAKFKIGFAVSDPKDLVLEASPDFMSEPVIFTNASS